MFSINISILLLFNFVIIILSYKYKRKIFIIYPFIFIFLITLYLQLIYKKNIDIMEGNLFYNDNKEVYSLWDRLNDDTYNDENLPILEKINKFIKLLLEVEEKDEEKYEKIKCEGKFIKKSSKKPCGYNAYDEKIYKITKPGINCKHIAGYSEKEFLPKCKLDEKCDNNKDCEKGKCHRERCKIDLKCDWDKLDNCDENGCDKLNEYVEYDKYKYSNGKCRINSCNEEQYYNCDEDGCEGLGYKFVWDENKKICKNRDYDVKTCNQVTCPSGYSLNENGKDYNCERKLSRDELEEKIGDPDMELNEEDEGFIYECNSENCCKENYTCERYFTKDGSICNCEDGNCDNNCFHGSELYSTDIFENGVEKTIYYNYKDVKDEGEAFPEGEKHCSGFECTKEECTQKCEDFNEDKEKCEANGCKYCLGSCFSELPEGECPDSCSGVKHEDGNCKYNDCKYCLSLGSCSEECRTCKNYAYCPGNWEYEGSDEECGVDCTPEKCCVCPLSDEQCKYGLKDGKCECNLIPCHNRNPTCDTCYVKHCNFVTFFHTCSNHYEKVDGGSEIGQYCKQVGTMCVSDTNADLCTISSGKEPN